MKSNYERQWEQCLDIIRDNLNNEEAFNAFFAKTRAVSYVDDRLVLMIPSHFVFERLESEYFDLLKKTLQRIYGPKIQLESQIQVTQEDEVKVERKALDPLYKKVTKFTSKYYVHDEKNESKVGDLVEIMETRPLSKLKRWRLVSIKKHAATD